ncbi:MAG: hypothetical protein ABIT38_17405 [Gemmatimonadaceae bacterium]
MANSNDRNDLNDLGKTGSRGSAASDWTSEESYWRNNWSSRPYAAADRTFDNYRPGYRYGYESANQMKGRSWSDAENDLRSGWDTYAHRGEGRSTWEQIKHSVKDAWERVTGGHDH